MATGARKELQKQLRAAFNLDSTTGSAQTFEDYEPPATLLEAVELYVSSSEGAQGPSSERDNLRLKEVLLGEGYEFVQASGSLQARSALIIVLDKFASLDSPVVTPKDIRETWWKRLLRPTLVSSIKDDTQIPVGRTAAQSAKHLLVKALIAASSSPFSSASDDKTAPSINNKGTEGGEKSSVQDESGRWKQEILRTYLQSKHESQAWINLQEVLVAWGKAQPRDFLGSILNNLDASPSEALFLLNTFIRLHPIQASQIAQTSLLGAISAKLNGISVPQFPQSSTSDDKGTASLPSPAAGATEKPSPSAQTYTSAADTVWISVALTTFNLILPRIPTYIDRNLDTLFLTLIKVTLWRDYVFHQRRDSQASGTGATSDPTTSPKEGQGEATLITSEQSQQHRSNTFPPLLDYFTTLYGLYPANTIYFLTNPIQWFASYTRRITRRRRAITGTGEGSQPRKTASLLSPGRAKRGGYASGGDSSTSGDDAFPRGNESYETDAETSQGGGGGEGGGTSEMDRPSDGDMSGSALGLRRGPPASRSKGKGRRSKLKKQKKDATAKEKRDKELRRQKERERRRRSGASAPASETDNQETESRAEESTTTNVKDGGAADGGSGLKRSVSDASSTKSRRDVNISSEAVKVQVNVLSPVDEATPSMTPGPAADSDHSPYDDKTGDEDDSSSDDDGEEAREMAQTSQGDVKLDEGLRKLDWSMFRVLCEPYLAQHIISPKMLCTPQAEFTRNKDRYRKLEPSDIIDEVVRSRVQPSSSSSSSSSANPLHAIMPFFLAENQTIASPVSPASQHSQPLTGLMSPGAKSQPLPAISTVVSQSTPTTTTTNPEVDNDLVILLQSQLGLENYQKSQLVHRLGTMLREHVVAGGAEADIQNLHHTVRLLRTQLQAAQTTLTQVRAEAATSRELLNNYSKTQATRLDNLREDRRQYNAENNKLKADLDELNASLKSLNLELMESKRKTFDLEAESALRNEKDRQKDEQIQRLKQELHARDATATDGHQSTNGQADAKSESHPPAQPEVKEE